jgi:hypothetical protein
MHQYFQNWVDSRAGYQYRFALTLILITFVIDSIAVFCERHVICLFVLGQYKN